MRDVSRKIGPPAMHTAKAGMRGGSHVDASARRDAGDFGISVFHRAWRRQRAAPTSLNRLPDDSVLYTSRGVWKDFPFSSDDTCARVLCELQFLCGILVNASRQIRCSYAFALARYCDYGCRLVSSIRPNRMTSAKRRGFYFGKTTNSKLG